MPNLRSPDGPHKAPKSDLVDRRNGAFDNVVPPSPEPLKENRTGYDPIGRGSAAMPETNPTDDSIPEGLQRERKGPYSPTRGRRAG